MFNEHPSENFCFSLELFQSYHDFHPPHSRLWESGSPGGESGEKYHDHRGPWRLPRDWPGLAWRSIPWHTGCPWSQGITLLPLRQRPSSIQKLSLTLDWRMYSFKGCPWKAFFDKNTTFFELWTLVGSQLHIRFKSETLLRNPRLLVFSKVDQTQPILGRFASLLLLAALRYHMFFITFWL